MDKKFYNNNVKICMKCNYSNNYKIKKDIIYMRLII